MGDSEKVLLQYNYGRLLCVLQQASLYTVYSLEYVSQFQ